MIERLFIFAIAVIPFTAVFSIPPLGELKNELSAFVFFLTLALSMAPVLTLDGRGRKPLLLLTNVYGLPTIAFAFFSVVLLSFAAHFPTIMHSTFQDRSGFGKFISSTGLAAYGFALALLTYALAGKRSWDDLILKPMAVSVIVCAVYSFFEIGGQYNGALAGVSKILAAVAHSGVPVPENDQRLTSVAFEPPNFANTAGYIWPWLLAAVQFSQGPKRMSYLALLLTLSGMIVLSEARTSLVVIGGLVVVFLALRTVYLPLVQKGDPGRNIPFANTLFLIVLTPVFLYVGLHADEIVRTVVTGASERVSNLSRLASMTAAARMFADEPFFGFGFGQYGFHVTTYMPSWGYMSYEIREWLSGANDYWPAVFSIYCRLGADMGIPGILVWILIWLGLARAVLCATLIHRKETGELPFASYPLIMSCFCVLLAGIPNDSLRTPMIWITMGLSCRYLYEMKQARLARLATSETP